MSRGPVTEHQNLGLLCFYPHRAMEARVLAAMAEAGFGDLTPAQGRVAARIDRDGTRLTDLAARALGTKQPAGPLVDSLERAGYVERVPDPRDARARLVRIAARGHAAVAVARPGGGGGGGGGGGAAGGAPAPGPARARRVRIAARGHAAVAVARRVEVEVEAEWTAHLGEEATAARRAALARLREVTDPYR